MNTTVQEKVQRQCPACGSHAVVLVNQGPFEPKGQVCGTCGFGRQFLRRRPGRPRTRPRELTPR